MESQLTGLKREGDHLRFTWSDGLVSALSIRELRISCPCAFCVNEITGARQVNPGDIPDDIGMKDMQPIGRYAYRVLFDDGHDTGLFTLEELRARCQEALA
ncbi:MAG: DUF971 domain-containing protein [Planctomycetota bacterium]|nr:DUF971 domain-containing protein [Planctomycetota bacterium]MDA1114503.1 DUF971 domain-containing protein [Planctomycetota bacterium]